MNQSVIDQINSNTIFLKNAVDKKISSSVEAAPNIILDWLPHNMFKNICLFRYCYLNGLHYQPLLHDFLNQKIRLIKQSSEKENVVVRL